MDYSGLGLAEAKILLEKFGPNELPSKSGYSLYKLTLNQFKNPFATLLVLASFLAFLTGDWLDAYFILGLVGLNTFLGVWQEFKASKELDILRKLEVSISRVLRSGRQIEIPSKNLVPGDIVILEAGDKIPADGFVIESFDLNVDESSLTGESLPILKTKFESDNLLYFGTSVISGRCKIKLIQTGTRTRFGKIALSLSSIEERQTSLQVSLSNLAKRLGIFALILSLIVFSFRFFRGESFLEVFLSSIALLVAAVPESLPSVITILLAVGVSRMYKKKVLVRKMAAVESLGSVGIILSDKTGTLTKNEMRVKNVELKEGDLKSLMKTAVLCNSATLVLKEDSVKVPGGLEENYDILGDSSEGALLLWAEKSNFDINEARSSGKIVDEVPFDIKSRKMSVVWEDNAKLTLFSKGAPESILPFCNLSDKEIQEATISYRKMASQGLRVLAFAKKNLSQGLKSLNVTQKDLIFQGFVGISDEVRDEASKAIAMANKAGIRVIMVTGDNELTAKKIAEEVGLLNQGDEIVTGLQLNEMSDQELRERIPKIGVFARVLPEHKLRIVKIFQGLGEQVAVTGDGVNDALALKQADVGVAMGKIGTDVAKEASDMIILDDNLMTIVMAVEQGRTIYHNILKTFKFLVVGNISEILTIVVAIFSGFPNPLLPIQLLWINFVTDGLPALSLAFDAPSPHIMSIPPRKVNVPILDKLTFKYILFWGLFISSLNIVLFSSVFYFYGIGPARIAVFTSMVLLQMVFVFIMRRHHSFYSNVYLLISVGVVVVIQCLIILVPDLRNLFKLNY